MTFCSLGFCKSHVCPPNTSSYLSPFSFFFLIFIFIYLLAVPDLSCGLLSLIPQPGIEPEPAVLGAESSPPGPPGMSLSTFCFCCLNSFGVGCFYPQKTWWTHELLWSRTAGICFLSLQNFWEFWIWANSQTIGRARVISWQGNHHWIFLSWLWWVGLKSGYHRAHHLERCHGQSGILNKTKHCKGPYVTVKIPDFPPHESSTKCSALNANQLGTALTPLCNSLNSTPSQVEAKNKITACSVQIQDLIFLCPASLRAQSLTDCRPWTSAGLN